MFIVVRCLLLVDCLLFCALCGRSLLFAGVVCCSLASFVGRRWLLLVLCCALLGVRDCWLFRVHWCLLIVAG